MPLGNYIVLQEGVPERVHMVSHVIDRRDIADPRTGQMVSRNVALFTCDRLNGSPISATLSVMSEKLFRQLEPYIPGQQYTRYDFVITKTGSGFATNFKVERIPL